MQFCSVAFQRHPRGDVRLMVQIGYDNLVSSVERLSDRQTHQANEGRGIHAECDFSGIVCVHQIGDAPACTRNGCVHCNAFRVASPTLHVALDEMMIHCVEHDLWNLRPRRIIEKGEFRSPTQSWEDSAHRIDGKLYIRSCWEFGVEN